jgi:hypothetical protein
MIFYFLASKIKAIFVVKFHKKISLRCMEYGAEKVRHVVVVSANQTITKTIMDGTLWS